jgi:hypothetical protein
MGKKKKNNKIEFILDSDWLFQGVLDAEQKQYVLLDYFQKLNKYFDEMKIYPMFIELSLHLGNVQTLLNQNKILYTDKIFTSNDDELMMTDLKLKEIPVLADEELVEYHKLLKVIQPQLYDYFNFAKSLWTVVYDSIDVKVKKNREHLKKKSGFFFYIRNDVLYVWKYTTKKVYNVKNQTKTTIEVIYEGTQKDLTIQELISKFSKTYEKDKEEEYPIFEVDCSEVFPLEETLLPIFKRKILAYINQVTKIKGINNKTIN